MSAEVLDETNMAAAKLEVIDVQEPAETPTSNVGIFRLNSYEWWVARSVDEAIKASAEHFRVSSHEVLDEHFPPYKLSPDELGSSTLWVEGSVVTFTTELVRRMDEGFVVPHLFGLSE